MHRYRANELGSLQTDENAVPGVVGARRTPGLHKALLSSKTALGGAAGNFAQAHTPGPWKTPAAGKTNVKTGRRLLGDITNATPGWGGHDEVKKSARAQVATRRKSGQYAPKPLAPVTQRRVHAEVAPVSNVHMREQSPVPEDGGVEYMPPSPKALPYVPPAALDWLSLLQPDNPDCYRFRRMPMDTLSTQLPSNVDAWSLPFDERERKAEPDALLAATPDVTDLLHCDIEETDTFELLPFVAFSVPTGPGHHERRRQPLSKLMRTMAQRVSREKGRMPITRRRASRILAVGSPLPPTRKRLSSGRKAGMPSRLPMLKARCELPTSAQPQPTLEHPMVTAAVSGSRIPQPRSFIAQNQRVDRPGDSRKQ
ncbi:hypothetical protein THASP1DRAFT_29933 [Thamnocephalis sphaerospora]|uniref:Uncharacterized protein n=1 Tax=Thamnocephalis sphaerospora TaxID=78915 RepID=A0A4P9XQD9_9FUNG|nr:hypothetical protein THASP1DRAFT_29933 [Thamnocephalis sphaerospora]|eukprot:RKP08254.1 hypothetical protein THASP1DRAFT_29933 [Thamnocephalis sphaerospora]